MRRALRLCIIASLMLPVSVLITTGCQSAQRSADAHASIDQLAGEWSLASLQGEPFTLPQGARQPTIKFTNDGAVSGVSGVNQFGTSLDLGALERGDFEIAPAASTKMAGPPEAMSLESRYFRLLDEATTLLIDGDSLSLSNAGTELMRFVRTN